MVTSEAPEQTLARVRQGLHAAPTWRLPARKFAGRTFVAHAEDAAPAMTTTATRAQGTKPPPVVDTRRWEVALGATAIPPENSSRENSAVRGGLPDWTRALFRNAALWNGAWLEWILWDDEHARNDENSRDEISRDDNWQREAAPAPRKSARRRHLRRWLPMGRI